MIKLRQVRQYHAEQQIKGLDMRIMAFMLQSNPYQWTMKGWVVSGYNGEDSHQLFNNKHQAQSFIKTLTS